METTLHRQLKAQYAPSEAETEVRVGNYRIDAVAGRELVEIQHASLASIRDKIRDLLNQRHRVRVVKPLVRRKTLIRLAKRQGEPLGQRLSPKRGRLLDLFADLVYFTRVFPHSLLTLEVVLVDVQEWRYPGHGRRRRRRERDFVVQDQSLVEVVESHQFRRAADLFALIPDGLPNPFHTGHLAESLAAPRGIAQQVAYCLRETGAIAQVGKQGNAILYRPKLAGRTRRVRKAS